QEPEGRKVNFPRVSKRPGSGAFVSLLERCRADRLPIGARLATDKGAPMAAGTALQAMRQAPRSNALGPRIGENRPSGYPGTAYRTSWLLEAGAPRPPPLKGREGIMPRSNRCGNGSTVPAPARPSILHA